jgi:hypothetical protein
LWPLVAFAVLLMGAATLCYIGISAVADDYDGFESWINVAAAGACCGASVLILIAAPVAWYLHQALRED